MDFDPLSVVFVAACLQIEVKFGGRGQVGHRRYCVLPDDGLFAMDGCAMSDVQFSVTSLSVNCWGSSFSASTREQSSHPHRHSSSWNEPGASYIQTGSQPVPPQPLLTVNTQRVSRMAQTPPAWRPEILRGGDSSHVQAQR